MKKNEHIDAEPSEKPGIVDCTSDLPEGTVLNLADPNLFQFLADAHKEALRKKRAAKPTGSKSSAFPAWMAKKTKRSSLSSGMRGDTVNPHFAAPALSTPKMK